MTRTALSTLFINNGKLANQIARLKAIVVKQIFDLLPTEWPHSSDGRALHRHHRGQLRSNPVGVT